MPNLVEISDFTGTYAIPIDQFTSDEFEAVRDAHQFDMIYLLMGGELGDLFIADLDSNGVPQTARFEALYDPFTEDYNGTVIKSLGIKEMVKAYLYMLFSRDNNVSLTITANVKKNGENSSTTSNSLFIVRKYNQAVDTAKAIQWYICQNSDDYPEENRQEIEYLSIY